MLFCSQIFFREFQPAIIFIDKDYFAIYSFNRYQHSLKKKMWPNCVFHLNGMYFPRYQYNSKNVVRVGWKKKRQVSAYKRDDCSTNAILKLLTETNMSFNGKTLLVLLIGEFGKRILENNKKKFSLSISVCILGMIGSAIGKTCCTRNGGYQVQDPDCLPGWSKAWAHTVDHCYAY